MCVQTEQPPNKLTSEHTQTRQQPNLPHYLPTNQPTSQPTNRPANQGLLELLMQQTLVGCEARHAVQQGQQRIRMLLNAIYEGASHDTVVLIQWAGLLSMRQS